MDRLERLARLCELVAAADGRIDGRKKLHKLAYLCQRAGTDLDQSFVFHMYGVYSPSLAQDVQAAAAWDLLNEKADSSAMGYEITIGPGSHNSGTKELTGAGLALVKKLARETSATLEVLSTIAYLWDAGYREPTLTYKLTKLKGHLSSHFAHAFTLATENDLVGATAL